MIDSLHKDSKALFSSKVRFKGVFFLCGCLQMSFMVCFREVDTLGLGFNGGNLVDGFLNREIGFCVDLLISSNSLFKSN